MFMGMLAFKATSRVNRLLKTTQRQQSIENKLP